MFDELSTLISSRLDGSVAAIESLRDDIAAIEAIITTITERLIAGGTVYTCGNGGSAAEAMHLAEELIGRYRGNRRPVPAVCLNADPTAITCIANDFGFEQVFARQAEALLAASDVLVAFSTSGHSANIIAALEAASQRGAATVALLGGSGGRAVETAGTAIVVRHDDSAHVQEAHQVLMHLICEAVEHAFSGS